jgi:hypothetical protein
MRPPATAVTAGLSATAAVLLLAGCGGSDEDPAAATSGASTASSSAAAESTGTSDEDVQAFCAQVEDVFSRVSAAYDPANVTGSLDESVAAFAEVQPPAEISADWSAIQDGLAGLRDTVAATDVGTPEGQAAAQAALVDFQTGTAGVQQNLERFVTANCDDAAPEAPASTPSS